MTGVQTCALPIYVADREFDRLVEEHRAKQTPVPSVTKTKVTPITQDANVMSAAPEYHTEVTVPALQAIQAGNFVPVTLKDGRQAKLVVGNNQEDTEGRVTAYDENNNEIGHVQYTKVEDEQGNRFNPHTVVDENYRRLGLATAMYDAAEQIGGAAIPSLEQEGQIRSEEGQAFREAREQKTQQTPAAVPAVQGDTEAIKNRIYELNAELAQQTTREGYDSVRKQLAEQQNLLGVSNETAEKVRKEGHYIDLDDPDAGWVENGQLWDGVTYYAGKYLARSRYEGEPPAAFIPITTLDEAKDAEAKGMSIYGLEKPKQKTVPELEREIGKLKADRNKLLTPTGREPKPGTKKRTQWDALTRKMDDLWGQISAIESGRVTPTPQAPAPTAPLQLTSEPFTIDVEARVVSDAINSTLSPAELQRLTSHYGLSPSSEKFIARVKEDIVRFATEGAGEIGRAHV